MSKRKVFRACLFWTMILVVRTDPGNVACAQEIFSDYGYSMHSEEAPTLMRMVSLQGKSTIFPGACSGYYLRHNTFVRFCSVYAGLKLGAKNLYAEAQWGLVYIDRTTSRLGTPIEFRTALFVRYTAEHYTIRIGLMHFSNASRFLGTRRPNRGENFLICGIDIPF